MQTSYQKVDQEPVADIKQDGMPAWRKILEQKVTIIPLYIYIPMILLITSLLVLNLYPKDLLGIIPLMVVMGYTLNAIGKRIPFVEKMGGGVILTLAVPPFLVYKHWIPPVALESITTFMKSTNALFLFITVVIVGSILGMSRTVLIKGFLKMFIPLLVGTLASVVVGVSVGTLLGIGAFKSFFFIVVPILAGGVTEGAIPLTIGYSQILGTANTAILGQVVPALVLGNFVAVILAGVLKYLGDKRPELSGRGQLIIAGDGDILKHSHRTEKAINFELLGVGAIIAISVYFIGLLLSPLTHIPGPVIMIFCAALIKVLGILPQTAEEASYMTSRLFTVVLTFPMISSWALSGYKWSDLISALTIPYFITILLTVLAMVVAGFYMGKLMKMYPIESAIVTACHSGMGGAGDLVILSSADRMGLMPYAQISTRIGGACMVIIAIILFRMFQ